MTVNKLDNERLLNSIRALVLGTVRQYVDSIIESLKEQVQQISQFSRQKLLKLLDGQSHLESRLDTFEERLLALETMIEDVESQVDNLYSVLDTLARGDSLDTLTQLTQDIKDTLDAQLSITDPVDINGGLE